jgi:hypothetical protein
VLLKRFVFEEKISLVFKKRLFEEILSFHGKLGNKLLQGGLKAF